MSSQCFGGNNTQKSFPVSLPDTLAFLHRCQTSVTKAQSKHSSEKNDLDLITQVQPVCPLQSSYNIPPLFLTQDIPWQKKTPDHCICIFYTIQKTVLSENIEFLRLCGCVNSIYCLFPAYIIILQKKKEKVLHVSCAYRKQLLPCSSLMVQGKRSKCKSSKTTRSDEHTRIKVKDELLSYVQVSFFLSKKK